jgi:predicted CXXCH cytochrome family protein
MSPFSIPRMTLAACLILPLRGELLQRALRAFPAFARLCLATSTVTLAAGQATAEADGTRVNGREAYVGTATCTRCHEAESAAWRGSHHDLAMQKPTVATVLGDFDNARFEHFGSVTEFSTRGGDYFVRTEGPDGERREYKVAWVFGVEPLQQYLLPLGDGRLQALSVAWDSRPASDGGQRWYHLYPDEAIAHDDPLHWTGPYQNWNARCAECHSTDVRKNYDAGTRSYATDFFEEDVGCESCHGPGRRHVELAGTDKLDNSVAAGFPVSLAARGTWVFPATKDASDDHGSVAAIAQRSEPLAGRAQIDTCARCHARRGTLGAYRHGQPLSDTHRLALLDAPLYYPDGQILDEVYVYGSFVQSRMHQAGVVCSNCHEPHSNQLRAPGNGVCAQCHQSAVFDTTDHHRHPAGGPGSQCVDCHMPARTYMGVDDRRDHSMRVPRPDLSIMAGTPNAGTGCHEDRDDEWALSALADWGVRHSNSGEHPAVAMAATARGDVRGAPRLAELAADAEAAPIWRATALERSAAMNNRRAVTLATQLLTAEDPLLRVSAVRALAALPPAQRLAYLTPLIEDPVTGVRMAVAEQLAGVPFERIDAQQRATLLALFDEYRSIQRDHADMPVANLQLGLFHARRGDLPAAEAAYRDAVAQNPQLLSARLNLADLLRSAGREDEARTQLSQALEVDPQSGDVMYALGLLEIRTGKRDAALAWLRRAAQLASAPARHRYVYAIAQHDTGDTAGSLRTLREVHERWPADEETLLALVNYSAEAGARQQALRYAQQLVELDPRNANYRRLQTALAGQR